MKYWAFDLDGTLVDSFSHYFTALTDIFNEHGAAFSEKLHHSALTESLPLFFEQHLGATVATAAMTKLQTRSNDDATRIQPFNGMTALVETLLNQGARVGVWTNRDLISAKLILEKTGLDRLVEICVSGTCVGQRKPHPEGLVKIIEHFKCAPEHITMVGDHEYDVLGAKEIGARSVRASWHSYWDVEKCTHADFQFHTVSEFSSWVALANERTP